MTTAPEQAGTGDIAEFAAFLVGHLGGRTHEEISTQMHALLAAVNEHGKKGSLTITVTVAPPKSAMDGAPLVIGIDSALKAPKASAPPAIYFVDSAGNPTRSDPRQLALDLRTAPSPTTFKDAH
jgi:hypothetical protein